MKVEQLMTRNPKTCGPDEPLEAAARLMWDHDVGCVPVVDKGQVVGMITDRDVCMAAYIAGAPLNTLRISRVMSTTVRSCKAGEPLASAERMMRLHKVRRLPVIDAAGRLVGILSLNDLAREAAREHVPETKDVSPEALTETLAAICELRRPQEIAAA